MSVDWLAPAVWLCLMAGVALAESSPERNADFLARAEAANQKCAVLNAEESQELSGYAAAARDGSKGKKAVAAARQGASVGAKVRCDAATSRGIRGVLESARKQGLERQSAVTQPVTIDPAVNPVPETTPPETAPPETATMAVQVPVISTEPAAPVPPPRKKVVQKKKTQEPAPQVLRKYETLAAAYFKELKCQRMSRREVLAFYDNVIKEHRRSITLYGSAKVAAAVRRAQARGKSGNC